MLSALTRLARSAKHVYIMSQDVFREQHFVVWLQAELIFNSINFSIMKKTPAPYFCKQK